MGTFSAEEDLWRFDTVAEGWEMVKTTGDKPEQRSFHVMQALGVRPFFRSLPSPHSAPPLLPLPTRELTNPTGYPLPARRLPSKRSSRDSPLPLPEHPLLVLPPQRPRPRTRRHCPRLPPLQLSRPVRRVRRVRARRSFGPL